VTYTYLLVLYPDCPLAQLGEMENVKRRDKGEREYSPDLTKCAVSSCIKVIGRPRNPFCWDTPGNVPTLSPEILC